MRAAFISIVDLMDIPVGEKVLRLQSSLTGKALTLVKRLPKGKGKAGEEVWGRETFAN